MAVALAVLGRLHTGVFQLNDEVSEELCTVAPVIVTLPLTEGSIFALGWYPDSLLEIEDDDAVRGEMVLHINVWECERNIYI